mmetsp:Transcript_134262/g.374221  ORF Transcript_134262/g.374221 Transcript_134262/m.374221 type:complete len:218 (-) Transcript_134262:117-770(-)
MVVERSLGTCLFCIPLRLGVSLIATAYFAYGFLCLMVLFTGDFRFQSGGYSLHTSKLQAFAGSAGTIFGFLGLLGLTDGDPARTRTLAHYQEVRLIVSLIVFVFDSIALTKCVTWASLPGSKAANLPLYQISSKGLCSMARLCYNIGFVIDFSLGYYFAWVTHTYCRRLASSSAYLIRFKDGTENHMQVKLFDTGNGEPFKYLGAPASRPSEVYGAI